MENDLYMETDSLDGRWSEELPEVWLRGVVGRAQAPLPASAHSEVARARRSAGVPHRAHVEHRVHHTESRGRIGHE